MGDKTWECFGVKAEADDQKQVRAFRRRVWRHNVRTGLSGMLFFVAAAANFGVAFLLGLAIWAVATGQRDWWDLKAYAWIFGASTALLFFLWGCRRIQKRGSLAWEGMSAAGGRPGGVRIQNKMGLDWAGTGSGLGALLLMTPLCLQKGWQKWRAVVRLDAEKLAKLERFRRDIAARESWEPVRHFFAHRREIEVLAKMGLLAIREYEGEWCLRISLDGQGARSFLGKGWPVVEN